MLIAQLRRRVSPLFVGMLAMTGLFAAVLAAQAQVPTAEQLRLLQNLSPEQQQAVLRQLGGAAAGTNSAGIPADGRLNSDPGGMQATIDEAARRVREGDRDSEPLIPVLKSGDTVLVHVDFPDSQGLQAGAAAGGAPVRFGGTTQPLQQAPGTANGTSAQQQPTRQPVPLDELERKKLEDLIALIRSRNPYQLDRAAQLVLPGFAPIALGGLTELQATQRLSAEPVLLKLEVRIVRLPLAKTGLEGLKRFGYDLFDEAPSTFLPVTDTPVPADYVIGAGDELNVQMFGSQNRSLRLVVSREGTVSLPDLGPIHVAGQRFTAAKSGIEARVSQQLTGVRASVSMGDVRSVRVFVLGEARRPGSYTVSGLATMTAALFASGGVKPIGSLRDIQLKRQGELVKRLDLYDLLVQGNTRDDARLLPGDVIFIPPVGPTVSVDGEVKRPAIYELRGEPDVADVLQMAGGFTPEADLTRASLTRIDDAGRRVVVDVGFDAGSVRSQRIRNGDLLRVARLRPQLDSGVTVGGSVHRAGVSAWREGLRLTDVLGSVDELRPDADQHYILIRRESGQDRHVEVLSADLTAALSARGSAADILLRPRDQLTVFDLAPGRERIIKPLLDELRLQSAINRPTEVVRVEGKVKVPGEYPLETGMKVSDLLRAGGNLESAAYGGRAELARYEINSNGSRQTELIDIDLAAVQRGDSGANLLLKPFDYLLIKETPNWSDQEEVMITGEVKFPGTYPIRRGETLHQVLLRAGGLTSLAFPKGSVFTRLELKQREQTQLDLLSDRLQTDLASLSLQAAAANQAGASQAMAAGQSLLGQLRQSKAIGRLVIDLPNVVASEPGSVNDVLLKNGDKLVVSQQKQEVTVIGEVQSVTSHLYNKRLDRDDYIALSGGMTRKADKGKIYVVRTDGTVVAQERSLFSRTYAIAIQPGDTIVVPLDTERLPRLPFWQAVTQILYNLAISAAAINSF